jgi:hypothetical protein
VVSGFMKKTRKTPRAEIALARSRMHEFERAEKDRTLTSQKRQVLKCQRTRISVRLSTTA